MLRLRFVLLTLSCLFFSSCLSTDPRNWADFGYRKVSNETDFLAVAALLAEYVPEYNGRVFAYSNLAEALLRKADFASAREVLRRGLLSARAARPSRKPELIVALATYYLRLGNYETGRSLIREALELCLKLDSELDRVNSLSAIIQLCFRYQTALAPLLRDAVDFTYIIENPFQKVGLLMDISERYREINVRSKVDVLIQHSINAALSIEKPHLKANAFVRIARAWLGEDKPDEYNKYIALALAELDATVGEQIAPSEAQVMQSTLLILIDLGWIREVVRFYGQLPYEEQQVTVQLSLIKRYLSAGPSGVFQARLTTQRLVNSVLGQQNPQRLALLYARIAEVYSLDRVETEALAYANLAVETIEASGLINADATLARLVEIYQRLGKLQQAKNQISKIDDGYQASLTISKYVDGLSKIVPKGELLNIVKEEAWLERAYAMAQKASFLKEDASALVVMQGAIEGRLEDVIQLADGIENPLLLSQLLSDLGMLALSDEELSQVQQNLNIIKSRWEKIALPKIR